MTPEERAVYVERFVEQLRDLLLNAEQFNVSHDRGLTKRYPVGQTIPELTPNGAHTFVIKINGGASGERLPEVEAIGTMQ